MARTVLATIGSLGDIHPFIAIGRALRAQGGQVTLAVPEDGLAKVRGAGLDAVPIFPSYADVCARLGLSEAEVAAKVIADPHFVVDQILLPTLGDSVRALDAVAADADVLAGTTFTFVADIVAEKRRLPLASVLLQPMTLFSAWAPPTAPRLEIMRHRPRTAIGRGWNRALYALVGRAFRRRYAGRIDAVRRAHGLEPARGAPLLDRPAAAATLCCWSAAFAALPPDAPAGAAITGFPFFDSEHGTAEPMAAELAAFLDKGDAPLVFTLGSVAVAAAGDFYREAAAAAGALGRRAVMLTGTGRTRREGDCLFMNYAPHSTLFPHAAAVIHHGGIGTTGQSLRAGCRQVVVPHFGDQFDNAARLRRAGLAATVARTAFSAPRAAHVIAGVLADTAMAEAAARAAAGIAGEDGAAATASRIAALA